MDELLSKLGLNNKESNAFLELLRSGPVPVSEWAKNTHNKRSSMYVLLEKLKELGFITTFTQHNITFAQTIPLDRISTLIDQRKRDIDDTAQLYDKHIDELRNLEETHAITPKVTFYEGKHQVAQAYENVLEEESFRAYFNPARLKEQMGEYFDKVPQALRAKKGFAKEILVPCKEADEYIEKYRTGIHEIKTLDGDTVFSSDTIITDEKIYLIGYSEDDVVATEIWNKELAQTQSQLFDIIWEQLA